jgi:glutaredoxin
MSSSPRRKKNIWTEKETEILKSSVLKYGKKWSIIEKNVEIFKNNGRTQVDLKDKWRNICKNENTPYKNCKPGYIIFTKQGCGWCEKAKDLIDNYREVKITDKNINVIFNFIDNITNKYRSFPIIFASTNINEEKLVNVIKKSKFIGGFSELEKNYRK